LEDELKKIVEKTFKTLNIATKDDLEKLENRISLLESMLLKGKSKKGKDSDKESDKASGSKKDSKKDKK
jgi:BMFP domain-containing protein YqiC